MATTRLYFDHDCADAEVVAELRRRGLDCLTAEEAGRQRATDPEQLEFATSDGRVLLTSNVGDFAALHREWSASGRRHLGVLLVPQRLGVGSKVRRVLMVLNSVPILDARLEYLSSWPDE
ncbi:MAG: DUF5615 family PIN-like protein [Tepidiformaceae bacterium]